MRDIEVKELKKVNAKKIFLLEGLPGVGNVGKIAVDFMVEALDAKKIFEFHSPFFPHCVFVNERGGFSLPKIGLYHIKRGKKDLFFLSGDVQPSGERACYLLSEAVLDVLKSFSVQEVVTLGGMALENIPDQPRVFYASSGKQSSEFYKKKHLSHCGGSVGPIIGMSGVLAGLAKERNIPSSILLAETFNHPTYIGVKESRLLLYILNSKFNLRLNLKELDKEIEMIEKEIKNKIERFFLQQREDDDYTH